MTADAAVASKPASIAESLTEKEIMALAATKEKEPGFFGRLLGKKSRKALRPPSEAAVPFATVFGPDSSAAGSKTSVTSSSLPLGNNPIFAPSVGSTTTTVTAAPPPPPEKQSKQSRQQKSRRESSARSKSRRSSAATSSRRSSSSTTGRRPSELRFLTVNDKGQPMAINITISHEATTHSTLPSPATSLPKVFDVTPAKAEPPSPKPKERRRFSLASRMQRKRQDSQTSQASQSSQATVPRMPELPPMLTGSTETAETKTRTSKTAYVPRHAGSDFGAMSMATAYRDSDLYVPHRNSDAARSKASADFMQQMANNAASGQSRRPSAVPSVAVSETSGDGDLSKMNSYVSSARPSFASSAAGRPVFDMDWTAAFSASAAAGSSSRLERSRGPESVASLDDDGNEGGPLSGGNSVRASYASATTAATTVSNASGGGGSKRYSTMSSQRQSMVFSAVEEHEDEDAHLYASGSHSPTDEVAVEDDSDEQKKSGASTASAKTRSGRPVAHPYFSASLAAHARGAQPARPPAEHHQDMVNRSTLVHQTPLRMNPPRPSPSSPPAYLHVRSYSVADVKGAYGRRRPGRLQLADKSGHAAGNAPSTSGGPAGSKQQGRPLSVHWASQMNSTIPARRTNLRQVAVPGDDGDNGEDSLGQLPSEAVSCASSRKASVATVGSNDSGSSSSSLSATSSGASLRKQRTVNVGSLSTGQQSRRPSVVSTTSQTGSSSRRPSVASLGKKVSSYIKPPRLPDPVDGSTPAHFSVASKTKICLDD